SCKPKSPTFYLRAVTASVNFDTGGDLNDFMHGWLNYQIEHHCWPDLSMLAYQKGQPELKQICEKYGVPYVQENVFVRLKKTLDIMKGKSQMRRYPDTFEREVDMMVWRDQAGRVVA
ncbi:D4, partial [Symbiodinium sp. CCMP2592]